MNRIKNVVDISYKRIWSSLLFIVLSSEIKLVNRITILHSIISLDQRIMIVHSYSLVVVRNWEDIRIFRLSSSWRDTSLYNSTTTFAATAALWAFCRSTILSASLSHFTSAVRNEKNISFVIIKRDVVCQSSIESCNFLSWSAVNTDDLSSTTKSNCGRESLMRGMNLIQLSSTISIRCSRFVASRKYRISTKRTRRGKRSRMILTSFLLRTL